MIRNKAREKNKNKRVWQVSQIIALIIIGFSMGIVLLTVVLNFALIWADRGAMADETIATITTYGGITATAGTAVYAALSLFRDMSLNKWGLRVPKDGSGKYYLPKPPSIQESIETRENINITEGKNNEDQLEEQTLEQEVLGRDSSMDHVHSDGV